MNKEDDLHKLIHIQFNVHRLIHSSVMKEFLGDKGGSEGMSLLHIHAMRFIMQSDELPTMHDVAQYLHVTPPSATSLMNTLVNVGYVRRVRGVKDRRTVSLELTAKGIEEIKKKRGRIENQMKIILEKLGVDDIKKMTTILEKIQTIYSKNNV